MPTSLWEKTFRLGYEKEKKKNLPWRRRRWEKKRENPDRFHFLLLSRKAASAAAAAAERHLIINLIRQRRGGKGERGGFLQRGFRFLFLFPPTVELASPGERRELARGPRRGFECPKNCTWLLKNRPHIVFGKWRRHRPTGKTRKVLFLLGETDRDRYLSLSPDS